LNWLRGKRTKQGLQIFVSLALLTILIWFVDPVQVARGIAGANPVILALALAVAFGNRVLMAAKWNILARAVGVRIPWVTAVSAYFTSTFAGIFLPPTIGGDAVRTMILSRTYARTAEIISSIIVERILGLLILAMFGLLAVAILALLFADRVPAAGSIALIILATTLALCAAVALLTRASFYALARRMVDRLARRSGFWARHADLIEKIRVSCQTFNERPFATISFSVLTVVENLMAIGRAWLVAVAFGVSIEPALFFVIIPIENFASRLPISFDGFGLREGLFLSVLAAFGVPPATALAIGLLNHLVFIVATLPGAWLLATRWGPVIFESRKKPAVESTLDR
jgi:glycosyltransferase 2 family protein